MAISFFSRNCSIYLLLTFNVSSFPPSSLLSRASSSLSSSVQSNLMECFPKPLILGSGSFTRKLILNEMGIDFIVIKRPIDEKIIGDRENHSAKELVLTLAKAKCDHLVSELKSGGCKDELPPDFSSYLVLTGDQVVTLGDKILEKPESESQAKEYCKEYALNAPSTVGSCVITHIPSGVQVSGVDSSTIYFKPSIGDKSEDGKDLVDQLLAEGAPILDCAGGLMIEHPLVQKHLERIDGTEDSVMGLSKKLVTELLQEIRTKMIDANLL
mmetsp:Transcript_18814/g.27821  ORF Transcript_18814/g.27821 Transcript_18814/m.27821 type:complete len:270 (-) Transcript_18814:101-910(-)